MNNCTIFCAQDRRGEVADAAARVVGNHALILSGSREQWSSLTVREAASVLTLNALICTQPGDRFSRLVLGINNFFRSIKLPPAAVPAAVNRTRILEHLSRCQLIIGAVADPEWTECYLDLVFEAADALGGIIFNGSGMLDPEGRLLLDSTGRLNP